MCSRFDRKEQKKKGRKEKRGGKERRNEGRKGRKIRKEAKKRNVNVFLGTSNFV